MRVKITLSQMKTKEGFNNVSLIKSSSHKKFLSEKMICARLCAAKGVVAVASTKMRSSTICLT